jgi:hypothetical protein
MGTKLACSNDNLKQMLNIPFQFPWGKGKGSLESIKERPSVHQVLK